MRLLAIVGLILLFSLGVVAAQPVREQIGPYEISFSVPAQVSIDIQTNQGETNNGTNYTFYDLTVTNVTDSSQSAVITIYSYAKPLGQLTEQYMSDIFVSLGFPKPTPSLDKLMLKQQ